MSKLEAWIDILFRLLFSTIFIGLGGEHLVSDELIQNMMPTWVPYPRIASVAAGLILIYGGLAIISGVGLKYATIILGLFVTGVNICVHLPALFYIPEYISQDDKWLWVVLQRSNFVKNICLLGVCIHLWGYKVGPVSLSNILHKLKKQSN